MPIPRISAKDARALYESGRRVVFVDARNPRAWGEADQQLPGALRIPADETANHLGEIPRDATIIAYCT